MFIVQFPCFTKKVFKWTEVQFPLGVCSTPLLLLCFRFRWFFLGPSEHDVQRPSILRTVDWTGYNLTRRLSNSGYRFDPIGGHPHCMARVFLKRVAPTVRRSVAPRVGSAKSLATMPQSPRATKPTAEVESLLFSSQNGRTARASSGSGSGRGVRERKTCEEVEMQSRYNWH